MPAPAARALDQLPALGLAVESDAAALACPACGALVEPIRRHWGCPRLHGGLLPETELAGRLVRLGWPADDAAAFLRDLRAGLARAHAGPGALRPAVGAVAVRPLDLWELAGEGGPG